MARECKKCGTHIPIRIRFMGKIRNMQRRKYCLECSPFGSGNSSKFGPPKFDKKVWNLEFARKHQRNRRIAVKKKLVLLMGGKCISCGYDRCLGSLEFHHRDPSTKVFGISSTGLLRKWDTLVEEAKKCDLLCSCCHVEQHNENLIDWQNKEYRHTENILG